MHVHREAFARRGGTSARDRLHTWTNHSPDVVTRAMLDERNWLKFLPSLACFSCRSDSAEYVSQFCVKRNYKQARGLFLKELMIL